MGDNFSTFEVFSDYINFKDTFHPQRVKVYQKVIRNSKKRNPQCTELPSSNFCGSFISSSILVQSHRVPIEKMLGHAVAFRGVVPGGSGGAMTPPDFGRSVNPISTRPGSGQIMPTK